MHRLTCPEIDSIIKEWFPKFYADLAPVDFGTLIVLSSMLQDALIEKNNKEDNENT